MQRSAAAGGDRVSVVINLHVDCNLLFNAALNATGVTVPVRNARFDGLFDIESVTLGALAD